MVRRSALSTPLVLVSPPAAATTSTSQFMTLDWQRLYMFMETVGDGSPAPGIRFCAEVADLTQARATLTLCGTERTSRSRQSRVATPWQFPVTFRTHSYGTLQVQAEVASAAIPALPLALVHTLAQVCGLALHLLTQSVALAGLAHHLTPSNIDPLTTREQEIVGYLVHGWTEGQIAHQLGISPATVHKHGEHIRQKLHVTTTSDVLLVAHHHALTYPLLGLPGPPPSVAPAPPSQSSRSRT